MSDFFIGEIRAFTFPFAPKYWALCNGQLLSIQQNQALFSLLGTNYGGNGIQTFGLPNLQGRVAVHTDPSFVLGEVGGEEQHTITALELPSHTHLATATTDVTNQGSVAAGAIPTSGANLYAPQGSITSPVSLHPATLTSVGQSQSHENRQPFTVINYCIALQGIFPSRF